MAGSTSFRLSAAARERLAGRAAEEGLSATALLERLIIEGVDVLDHPGIVFRGPAHDRRAALAVGPDVWEIVGRLQELDGDLESRIRLIAEELDLHPRIIRVAVDYAAEHVDVVSQHIVRNAAAARRSRQAAESRHALLT